MTTQAILLEEPTQVRVADVELDGPGPGEVRVRMGATGVCHSDVGVYTGHLPTRRPIILGHEGAGTVVDVGAGVTHLEPGDRVALSWLVQCGQCTFCRGGQAFLCAQGRSQLGNNALPGRRLPARVDGVPVNQFCGLGTFAREVVVHAGSAIKVPSTLPMTTAALIGCGVVTGFGAAVNTARVRVGESVVVVGCGGVGLNAVQGARIAGATTIIAVDLHKDRLKIAADLGATHTLLSDDQVIEHIRELTGGLGADKVIEVAGRQATVNLAVRAARRGGDVSLVGAAPEVVIEDAFTEVIMAARAVRGCLYGSSDVQHDIPMLVDLYEQGHLRLDELVTRTYAFDEVQQAIEYCSGEQGARAVVILDESLEA
ncbi:MAG: zinc-binding dehydrogenase [Tetrasphaera sp.]